MTERVRNLVLRVSDDELAMAHAVAADRDETIARVVRRFIRDAYVERFGVTVPPKPKLKHSK